MFPRCSKESYDNPPFQWVRKMRGPACYGNPGVTLLEIVSSRWPIRTLVFLLPRGDGKAALFLEVTLGSYLTSPSPVYLFTKVQCPGPLDDSTQANYKARWGRVSVSPIGLVTGLHYIRFSLRISAPQVNRYLFYPTKDQRCRSSQGRRVPS